MRVLVTGAASGIGRATCLRLARDAQAARREGAGGGGRHRAVGRRSTASSRSCARSAPRRCRSTATWPTPMRRRGSSARRSSASAASTGWSATPASTGPGRSSTTRSTTGTACSPSTRARRGCSPRPPIPRSRRRAAPSWPSASMSGSNAHANLGAYGPSKAAVIMLVAGAGPGVRPRRHPRQHRLARAWCARA